MGERGHEAADDGLGVDRRAGDGVDAHRLLGDDLLVVPLDVLTARERAAVLVQGLGEGADPLLGAGVLARRLPRRPSRRPCDLLSKAWPTCIVRPRVSSRLTLWLRRTTPRSQRPQTTDFASINRNLAIMGRQFGRMFPCSGEHSPVYWELWKGSF